MLCERKSERVLLDLMIVYYQESDITVCCFGADLEHCLCGWN